VIKPPSLQQPYHLVYSGDPALSLPEAEDERARVLQVARETGRWDDLVMAGQQPTLFLVKPLTGTAFNYWCGEVQRRGLIEREAAALALRLALLEVTNLGDLKVKPIGVDGFKLAPVESVDAIYAAAGSEGAACIMELGAHIIERASESPSPK
jgi:hypothetical protein